MLVTNAKTLSLRKQTSRNTSIVKTYVEYVVSHDLVTRTGWDVDARLCHATTLIVFDIQIGPIERTVVGCWIKTELTLARYGNGEYGQEKRNGGVHVARGETL